MKLKSVEVSLVNRSSWLLLSRVSHEIVPVSCSFRVLKCQRIFGYELFVLGQVLLSIIEGECIGICESIGGKNCTEFDDKDCLGDRGFLGTVKVTYYM